jgi:DNA photolyase
VDRFETRAVSETRRERESSKEAGAPAASRTLVWFRRDLRLRDHGALTAAARAGREVVAGYVLDERARGGAEPQAAGGCTRA